MIDIAVRDLKKEYEVGQPVLDGLTFQVDTGERVGILGRNGAGKTTLFRILTGQEEADSGEVILSPGKRLGLISQIPVYPAGYTVEDVLRTAFDDLKAMEAELHQISDQLGSGDKDLLARYDRLQAAYEAGGGYEIETRLEKICAGLGIERAFRDKNFADLSGGEKTRINLARLILVDTEILLLDEPTKGLDAEFKQAFALILRTLLARGVSLLMVSHDVEFCARYAHRCALFFDGSVVTEASPRAFFSGNSFYTTAANRMARSLEPQAVTAEDVMAVCGGTVPAEPALPEDIPPLPEPREETPDWKPKKLPLWRKALAAVSGAGALAIFLYATGVTDLSAAVGKGGLTALGWQQLRLYLVFCGLLLVLALSIGRRTKPLDLVQVPAEKRRLSRRTAAAAVSILLLIPVTLFVGVYYLDNRQYGLMSVLVLLECMAPFFLVFEGRRPQARELVVIAVLCAISVAGRAAFFMLPQFKPVMAMTIISGVALGGESGFLVGALSMLVSNMLFSQGVWTPWQMFSMGIIGFLSGVLFRKGLLRRTLGSMCTFGAFCAIVIYGGIMNPASVLMWAGAESLTWKTLLTYYVTGFPVDCVHAAATVFFLWVAAEPMLEKLDRIKEKYGLLT